MSSNRTSRRERNRPGQRPSPKLLCNVIRGKSTASKAPLRRGFLLFSQLFSFFATLCALSPQFPRQLSGSPFLPVMLMPTPPKSLVHTNSQVVRRHLFIFTQSLPGLLLSS